MGQGLYRIFLFTCAPFHRHVLVIPYVLARIFLNKLKLLFKRSELYLDILFLDIFFSEHYYLYVTLHLLVWGGV